MIIIVYRFVVADSKVMFRGGRLCLVRYGIYYRSYRHFRYQYASVTFLTGLLEPGGYGVKVVLKSLPATRCFYKDISILQVLVIYWYIITELSGTGWRG